MALAIRNIVRDQSKYGLLTSDSLPAGCQLFYATAVNSISYYEFLVLYPREIIVIRNFYNNTNLFKFSCFELIHFN